MDLAKEGIDPKTLKGTPMEVGKPSYWHTWLQRQLFVLAAVHTGHRKKGKGAMLKSALMLLHEDAEYTEYGCYIVLGH